MHWVLLIQELLRVGWPSRQYQHHISSALTSSVSSSTVTSPGNDDWTTPYESSVYDADTRWDRPTDRQPNVMLCWLTQQKNCGLSYVVIYKVEYLYVCLLPIISAPLQSTPTCNTLSVLWTFIHINYMLRSSSLKQVTKQNNQQSQVKLQKFTFTSAML